MNADCKKWAGAAAKAKEEVTKHKKLIKELGLMHWRKIFVLTICKR